MQGASFIMDEQNREPARRGRLDFHKLRTGSVIALSGIAIPMIILLTLLASAHGYDALSFAIMGIGGLCVYIGHTVLQNQGRKLTTQQILLYSFIVISTMITISAAFFVIGFATDGRFFSATVVFDGMLLIGTTISMIICLFLAITKR